MSKKPSAETLLRRERAQFRHDMEQLEAARKRAVDQLHTEQTRVHQLIACERGLRDQVADLQHRLANCDGERRMLLKALCDGRAAIELTDPAPTKRYRWRVGQKTISAIRALRGATPVPGSPSGVKLGLAEAKHIYESGNHELSDKEHEALSPYVEWLS